LRDGTLVRSQINCFALGCDNDDGSYFENFAREMNEERDGQAGHRFAFRLLAE
jgi:hypothetical protein